MDLFVACELSFLERAEVCIHFYHHVTKKRKFIKNCLHSKSQY